MARRTRRARIHADLDEIAPNTFIIHNDKLRPVLRGEGVAIGHTFELVSTRRAGLLARLRIRQFNVRTLHSRLLRLPPLPAATPPGETVWREISQRERWSRFDHDTLRWRDIKPETRGGKPALGVALGEILRRRHSRGAGAYFQAAPEGKGGLNLLPLGETEALLRGYAQATADSDILVDVEARDADYLLPLPFVLPSPHLELLRRIGTQLKEGVLIAPVGWKLAVATLHSLNLRPSEGDIEVVEFDEVFEEWEEMDADEDEDDDEDDE
ncbi:MAG TPA: hypothetical protein VGE07_13235 [Herpetosiphonaceae bacterium]